MSPSNPKWPRRPGRVVGTRLHAGKTSTETASGYQYKQPGHPDSTFQESYCGVLATGLFIVSDELRREDCSAGRIDHAVGLLVHNAKPGHVWLVGRNDGTQASSSLLEGMRLRFPPTMAKPAFSNRFASRQFGAAQDYGLVIDDMTGPTSPSAWSRSEMAAPPPNAGRCWTAPAATRP